MRGPKVFPSERAPLVIATENNPFLFECWPPNKNSEKDRYHLQILDGRSALEDPVRPARLHPGPVEVCSKSESGECIGVEVHIVGVSPVRF